MAQTDATPRDALMRLGASTAEAIARVLEVFVPGQVERGEVTVTPDGSSPFSSLPFGGVAASISYVDGVTGANIFVMTASGARALASAMGVGTAEGEAAPPTELSELELSAVGEAANQMLAAAAGAISVVLGQEIQISPPDTRIVDDSQAATELYGTSPHACTTSFTVSGEPCRLIQLVPSTFVVRMARAIDEMGADDGSGDGLRSLRDGAKNGNGPVSLPDALRDINLRVWAELGRAKLGLGQALELPIGAVVDLDRAAEAPVDLFVNGLCFGSGHLLVTDDGEWAIRVEELTGPTERKPVMTGPLPNQAMKGPD